MGEKRKKSEKDGPGERGATKCAEALAAISEKKRLELTWDSKGVPTGPNAKTLSTWIGVSTKLYVNIDLDDFRKLIPLRKKLLLDRIKEAFDIPDCHDQYLLKKAAACFRQWKCDIAEKHLYLNKETGEMRKDPPAKYSNISQAQWDNYKTTRASEKFKAISDQNRANIAKKESKYYGSRGGYRLIEDILKKEQGKEEIERHITYKAGHTPKGDRVRTKYDTKIIANIEEVLKEVAEGEFIPTGRDDILARAIGRPEHPGRLRGVPLHVGVTRYYGKTPPPKKKKKTCGKYTDQMVQLLVSVILKMNAGGKPSEEELKIMEDIIKEGKKQEEVVNEVEAGKTDMMVVTEKEVAVQKEVAVEMEVATEVSLEVTSIPSEAGKVNTRVAILTHPSVDKVVRVARAVVYLHDPSTERVTVHCVPLLKNHRKVVIGQIHPNYENLELPVPIPNELTVMKDAINAFVQWPCQHIYFQSQGTKNTRDKEPKVQVGTMNKTSKEYDSIPIPSASSTSLPKIQVKGTEKTAEEDSRATPSTSTTSFAKNLVGVLEYPSNRREQYSS